MGYTHYWQHDGIDVGEWGLVRESFRQILLRVEAEGLPLAGGNGLGRPSVTADMIRFNGVDGEHFETFALTREAVGSASCKTDFRAYDLAVTAVLLRCVILIGDTFRVKSNGDYATAWQPARELVDELWPGQVPESSPLRNLR